MTQKLTNMNFDPNIVLMIQCNLHDVLQLGGQPLHTHTPSLRPAYCQQNIIGWRNFLRGYISEKWTLAQEQYVSQTKSTLQRKWSQELIKATLELHLGTWQDRNNVIKGISTTEINRVEQDWLLTEVISIYAENFTLDAIFPSISSVPLHIRLQRSAKHLKKWIHKVRHQRKVTHIF
jgi:hypothetical protein